jgi:hypothetical protein
VPTGPTTRRASSPGCAGSTPRRTWRRTSLAGPRASTARPCATLRLFGEPTGAQADRGGFSPGIKTIGVQANTSFRGTARVGWVLTLAASAYNLIRLPKLLGALP